MNIDFFRDCMIPFFRAYRTKGQEITDGIFLGFLPKTQRNLLRNFCPGL